MIHIPSSEEAVQLFQRSGLVGAGGGAFPTYFKYHHTGPTLLINTEDSEPGYHKDSLILRGNVGAFQKTIEALKAIFRAERVLVAVKEKYKKVYAPLEGQLDFFYSDNSYFAGEAKYLVWQYTGRKVPAGKHCADFGVIVSCTETVYNMYQCLFHSHPVTTKVLQVYGEVSAPRMYRVPVGAYAQDLLWMTGVSTAPHPHLMVIAGGPMMGREVNAGNYTINKATNDLFVTRDDFFSLRNERNPTWQATPWEIAESLEIREVLEWNPEPSDIVDLCSVIERVKIDLHQTGRFGVPSQPVVREGQEVQVGDEIAVAADGKLSVSVHASISGVVQEVTERYISLRKGVGRVNTAAKRFRTEEVQSQPVLVPASARYGGRTARTLASVDCSPWKMPEGVLRNQVVVKKALIAVDLEDGRLHHDSASALDQAATEYLEGKGGAEFPLDLFSDLDGLALEQCLNEILGNRAQEILGWEPGSFGAFQAPYHQYLVDFYRSAGCSTIRPAAHLEALGIIARSVLPAVEQLGPLQEKNMGSRSWLRQQQQAIQEIRDVLARLPLPELPNRGEDYARRVATKISQTVGMLLESSRATSSETYLKAAETVVKIANGLEQLVRGPNGDNFLDDDTLRFLNGRTRMLVFAMEGSFSLLQHSAQSGQLDECAYSPLVGSVFTQLFQLLHLQLQAVLAIFKMRFSDRKVS